MASSEPDIHAGTKRFVDRWCDNLATVDVDWAAASEPTKRYNCFGFAVGREAWWQAPIFIDGIRANPTHHWPAGVADDGSIDAYVRAAELEGFVVVDGGGWLDGFETIALYFTERDRQFSHAARQTSPRVWASKLGGLSDISHPANGVDCLQYGRGTRVHGAAVNAAGAAGLARICSPPKWTPMVPGRAKRFGEKSLPAKAASPRNRARSGRIDPDHRARGSTPSRWRTKKSLRRRSP